MGIISRRVTVIAACTALACGQQAKKAIAPPATTGTSTSKVHVTSNSKPHTPANLEAYTGSICMTLDLTPYAFVNGAQTSPGVSGPTVTIHTTPTPTDTDAVIACTSGGGTDGLSDGYNWGYTVSAYDFGDCSTYTQPDGTVVYDGSDGVHAAGTPAPAGSPANGVGYPTNPFPTSPVPSQQGMVCNEDADSELALAINLNLVESNGTGYVDVATTVNDIPVMVGCKTADFGTTGDGILHYGSTTTYDTGNYGGTGTAPLALTGVGFIDSDGTVESLPAAPAPAIAQFAGIINADPDSMGNSQDGAYITGTLNQSITPTSGVIGNWDVVQTFLPRPPDSTSWCGGTLVPECDTTVASNADPTDPTQVHTTTRLASAVITLPGGQWLIANVTPDGTGLQITSGTPTQFSDPSLIAPPSNTSWNAETTNIVIPFGLMIDEIAIDPSHPGALLVVTNNGDGTKTNYAVSNSGGLWTAVAGPFSPAQLVALASPISTGCHEIPQTPYTRCGGGDGLTPETAYKICNAAAFAYMGNSGDSTAPGQQLFFEQTNDILDLDATATNVAQVWSPFEFDQVYDGKNFIIRYNDPNPSNNDDGAQNQGLFSTLDCGAVVKNLDIEATVSGSDSVGGLAGWVNNSSSIPVSIQDVNVSGTVTAFANVGGITAGVNVPRAASETFSGISSDALVTQTAGALWTAGSGLPAPDPTENSCDWISEDDLGVGGLIGQVYSFRSRGLTINNCSMSGQIVASGGFVGGISGPPGDNFVLNNCLFVGTLPSVDTEICPGAVGALISSDNEESGNDASASLWATDIANGCSAEGCTSSGFLLSDPTTIGYTMAQLGDPASYPLTWDFTNTWNEPAGGAPATLIRNWQ